MFKVMFSQAADLHVGQVIDRYTLGTRAQRAFENLDTRPYEVTESFLGETANFMQHRSAWRLMQERDWKRLLIMEDDSFFAPWFNGRFQAMLDEFWQDVHPTISADFDVLYIGTCLDKSPNRPWTTRKSANWYHAQGMRCASGYLLSRQGADKLLAIGHEGQAQVPEGFRAVDSWMEFYMQDLLTEVYWLEPALIYEGTKALNPTYTSFHVGKSGFNWLISLLFGATEG